jgi:hypothetical protein
LIKNLIYVIFYLPILANRYFLTYNFMNVKVSELTSNVESQSCESVNLGLHRVSRRLKIKKFTTNFWRYKMKSFLSYTILGVFALMFSGCCGGNVTPSTPTEPEPPTGESYAYLTLEGRSGGGDDHEIYVTNQPARGVDYTFVPAGTGEYSDKAYYLGTMTSSKNLYVTDWTDGTFSYSDGPYRGVDYRHEFSADFNTVFNRTGAHDELLRTDVDEWWVSVEVTDHVPDDYEFRAFDDGEDHISDGEYVLKGTTGNVTDYTNSNNDDDADSNDFNNLPEANDELPLSDI